MRRMALVMDLKLALNPDYYVLSTAHQCLLSRCGDTDYEIIQCTQSLADALGWKDHRQISEYLNESLILKMHLVHLQGKLATLDVFLKGQCFDGLELLPISGTELFVTVNPSKVQNEESTRESIAHRLAVQNIEDAVVMTSVKGDVLECNLAGSRLFGKGNVFELVVPNHVPRLKEAFRHAASQGHRSACKVDVLTNHRPVAFQFSLTTVDNETILLIGKEQSSRVARLSQLSKVENQQDLILESITDGFITLNDKLKISFCNEKARSLLGEDLLHRSIEQAMGGTAAEMVKLQVERCILTGKSAQFEINISGSSAWQQVRVYPAKHAVSLFITDITKLKAQESRMVQLAMYDTLTGLLNRESLKLELELALTESRQRPEGHMALVMLDLDGFKLVNDTQGHPVGDLLLKEVGARFKAALRTHDVVARLGGDEFMVILKHVPDSATAQRLANKLVHCISDEPFQVKGLEQRIGASAGIALYPQHAQSEEDLMKCVDIGLYEAKRNGKGFAAVYHPTMAEALSRRARLDFDMRAALQNRQIDLEYQPKTLSVQTEIVGVESLARWTHPEYGVISPQEFIDIAEQSGMIQELGEYLLQRACEAGAKLNAVTQLPKTLAFNVSVRELLSDDFVDVVRFALEQSGLSPALLELEITERALMENSQKALVQVNKLKELGVSIIVDDFGTGHCSLMYLAKFPLDGLKLDQQFVQGLPQCKESREITKAVIALGQALELSVCAEGVESEAQLDCLVEFGVDMTQGFHISRPLSLEGVIAYCTTRELG